MLSGKMPQNIERNGGLLGGVVSLRNLTEGIISFLLVWFLFYICLGFLPEILKLLLLLTFGGLSSIICIIGINGKTISETVLDYFIFKKRNFVILIRVPRPTVEYKKEEEPKKKNLFGRLKKGSE